jgi:serine/threonine protein kinase
MAPEQIERPLSVDHRADIYSLGVVLYELLTGELPLGRFALPSERGTIDAGLDQVVLRALERDPARRYQHASELKTDVTSVSSEEAIPTPAAPAAPVLTVPFWAPTSLITNSTSRGFVELYGDRVACDFEVVSTWDRDRSGLCISLSIVCAQWSSLTRGWRESSFRCRSNMDRGRSSCPSRGRARSGSRSARRKGEGFVAAMRERLGKVTSPCL